jgi:pilus assembly protein CpaB
MRTRGLVVAVAALFAVLATAGVYMYVRGVRNGSGGGGASVSVIVAKSDIPVGTKLDDIIASGGLTSRTFPRDNVVRGAVTDVADLKGKTTNAPILAGEQISSARLEGSETQPTGGVLGIPAGFEAVTFSMPVPQAGGGVVQVGDHISIYATFSSLSLLRQSNLTGFLSGKAPVNNDEQKVGDFIVTVAPDVQVLKVVQPPITASSTQANIQLTLALTPEDAAKVVFAQEKGTVWTALLPPNQAGKPVPPTSYLDLLPAQGAK